MWKNKPFCQYFLCKGPERNTVHAVSEGAFSPRKEDPNNINEEMGVMSLQYGIFTAIKDLALNEVSVFVGAIKTKW